MAKGLITDNPNPRFSFFLESDTKDVSLANTYIEFEDGHRLSLPDETGACYDGQALKPLTKYQATLTVEDNQGRKAPETVALQTGTMVTHRRRIHVHREAHFA